MHISQNDKEAIIVWALKFPEIAKVWLYGSRARGDHDPDSVALERDASSEIV